MSRYRILAFISFIVSGYLVVNGFIFLYGMNALSVFPVLQPVFAVLFWMIALMFPVARILERFYKNPFISFILWVGSFWLAMLTYIIIGLVGLTVGTLIVAKFFPELNLTDPYLALSLLICMVTASFVLSAYGWKNARHPAIRRLEYTFPKGSGKGGEFHIVAATDIHLGTLIGKKRFGRFVRDVNALKPDAIFLVGDTIDEDIEPVIKQDIGTSIRKLHAPLGVFAVNGNHEHIGGVERADAYLIEHGVTMLRDESIVLGGAFTLVGREDISYPMFSGKPRKTLDSLLAEVDPALPIILMDHQPGAIRQVAKDGRVALQLSGHTHHGQLWPLSLITKSIFEISWGGKKIGNTEFYVSSGWGTWGPPVRTGNIPELLDIRLTFK